LLGALGGDHGHPAENAVHGHHPYHLNETAERDLEHQNPRRFLRAAADPDEPGSPVATEGPSETMVRAMSNHDRAAEAGHAGD
jgi:hypothetical protein